MVGVDSGLDIVADPSQLFEIPPEMSYNQPITLKFIEGFESVSDTGNVRAEMEKRARKKAK